MAFVPGYPSYQQPIVNGATSKSIFLYCTAASGLPVAGLAFDTAGLLASYAGTKLARVAITLADLAAITTAWSSGGFKEVDGTNMPGWYRLDVPNAALALSADEVVVTLVKDAVVTAATVIPIPTATVGSITTTLTNADLGNPLSGTLAQNVEAIAAGIPFLDVIVDGQTARTDH
jgi:hypothetical protein